MALTIDLYEKNNYLVRNDYQPKLYNIPDIECIQSASAPNDSQIMVTVYDISGSTKTVIINLDDINDIKAGLVSYGFQDNFCNINYTTKIFYFKDDQKFITSCLDTNGNLLMEIYDKELICQDRIKIDNYTIDYGYSILYSKCTNNYYLTSDNKNFQLLMGKEKTLTNDEIKKCFNITDSDSEESGSSSTVIIIVILISIILIIAGFLFYRYYRKKKNNDISLQMIQALPNKSNITKDKD